MKDMTGNDYVEKILKDLYVAILFEIIEYSIEENVNDFSFIENEMHDSRYVTCITIDADHRIRTEDTGQYVILEYNGFDKLINRLFNYCGCTDIVIYNVRGWYESEVIPQLDPLIKVAKL